jgi:hypothetical protein
LINVKLCLVSNSAKALPAYSNVYAVLVAVMNASKESFGAEILKRLGDDMQKALAVYSSTDFRLMVCTLPAT